MEQILQIQNLIKEANKSFNAANHLANVTYSLLKDKRLMLSIINNLCSASLSSIAAILYYEKLYKRIHTLPMDIGSRLDMFENTMSKRYKISESAVSVTRKLKLILDQHKQSPIEFSRKESFVICNDDYSQINVVDMEKLKNYILNVRELIGLVNSLKC